MTYYKNSLKKALLLRDEIFGDAGNGLFKNKLWAFVLHDAKLNLHPSIRHQAIAYFKKYKIPFWNTVKEGPTGHLLSSQVACINHLFFLMDKPDIATAVLKGIDPLIKKALPITENGFVDFEVIGEKNYLGEKSHSRGANSTSIDAAMLGQLKDGSKKIYFIEWKYTESYTSDSKAKGQPGITRLGIYSPLLACEDCPIEIEEVKHLFIEPYYQLMRQTLLAHEIVKAKEFGANDYLHIHAIPKQNLNLKAKNTSPGLKGADLDSTWKNVLKHPEKYRAIDPQDLLEPANSFSETNEIIQYLRQRYWEE
jgi:hypothetical protein